jgi:hypothetical protein
VAFGKIRLVLEDFLKDRNGSGKSPLLESVEALQEEGLWHI